MVDFETWWSVLNFAMKIFCLHALGTDRFDVYTNAILHCDVSGWKTPYGLVFVCLKNTVIHEHNVFDTLVSRDQTRIRHV